MELALPLAVSLAYSLYISYQYAKLKAIVRHIVKSSAECKYWEKKLGL